MKEIKLIELLTKIANGDNDLPKRIIFDYKLFELEAFSHYEYKGRDLMEIIRDYVNINVALNDKVEILESQE